jgi:hypothetical protein
VESGRSVTQKGPAKAGHSYRFVPSVIHVTVAVRSPAYFSVMTMRAVPSSSKQETDMKNGLELTVEGEVLNEDQLEFICGGYKNNQNPVVDLVLSTAYDTACQGLNLSGACFNLFFANH